MEAARCLCGTVEIEASGPVIASVACYCDSCRIGSAQIERLPGAPPVLGPDGGTAYVLYRKDRVRYVKGADKLKGFTLAGNATTNRVVATCCNAPMVMRFDDAKHWVPVYRARLSGDVAPLQWRICTKDKPADAELPSDVPNYAGYPPAFIRRLLAAKIAMILRR